MTTISRDEWLKALTDVCGTFENDQEAVTILEFAAMFGLERQAAVRRLEAMVAAGKARRTKKVVRDDYGRTRSYIAYRLT